MRNEDLVIRKNRFISYIILAITVFTINSMKVFLYGSPFIVLALILAHIKKKPHLMSYFVVLFGFGFVFIKSRFDESISIPLIIFVFLSLSIVFQRIGLVIFSATLSYSIFTYYIVNPTYANEELHTPTALQIIGESMFYQYAYFLLTFVSALYLFQTYTFQKLQKKSETETINAKKGRKKVNLLLNRMTESTQSVSDFSTTLNENILNLKESSEESLAGFKDMNETFSLQNVNVKAIDNNIHQIDEHIQIVTNSFGHMFDNLQTTTKTTSDGYVRLQNLEGKITNMDQTMHFLTKDMENLNQQSDDIMTMLEFIYDIANKTNILALNASIEAARAGNEGKGFAIVANEVKNLAEQSRQSVKKIEEIVQKITQQTNKATERAKNSEQVVWQSKEALKELNQSFDTILKGTNETFHLSSEVRNRIEGLSQSSNQIVDQIIHLTNANTQNTSEIEELFMIVEKQNEHIHQISDGFETLEKRLQVLSSQK